MAPSVRGPSPARSPHFFLRGRCTGRRKDLPVLPRTAVPVRWAVRGEGEAVGRGGSVRSASATCSEKRKEKPPVINSGSAAATFVEHGARVMMREARSTAYGARSGRSSGRSTASRAAGAPLAPTPRCPVFRQACPARRRRSRRPGVPRRYELRNASLRRRRRRRRRTGSRLRPTCCPRRRRGCGVETPRPRRPGRQRPTRPLLRPPGWPQGLQTIQTVAKAPGEGMRATCEAPRWRAAVAATRASASRWRASGIVTSEIGKWVSGCTRARSAS